MKRYPAYSRTVLTTQDGAGTVYHVNLTSLTECGDKVIGRAHHADQEIAVALALARLAKKADASRDRCIRRGTHHH